MKVRITKVPDKSLNAKKWKHGDGGFLNEFYDGGDKYDLNTGLMYSVPQEEATIDAPIPYTNEGYQKKLFYDDPANRRMYTIAPGDTMWGIAQRENMPIYGLLQMNPSVGDGSKIQPGQQIMLGYNKPLPKSTVPASKDEDNIVYNVQKGDYLGKIAKDNGISMKELLELNPQFVGRENNIAIGEGVNLGKAKQERKFKTIKERRDWENSLDNLASIQNYKHTKNYAVVDKDAQTMTVYSPDNKVVRVLHVNTGSSNQDFNTKTYEDERGHILYGQGNMSTPAGITEIVSIGKDYGHASYVRARVGNDGKVRQVRDSNGNLVNDTIASSMHYEKGLYGPNQSNGCIRLNGKDADELKDILGVGSRVYTLPQVRDDSGNATSWFKLEDGKLSFYAKDPVGETENTGFEPVPVYEKGKIKKDKNGNVVYRDFASEDDYNQSVDMTAGDLYSAYDSSEYPELPSIPETLYQNVVGNGEELPIGSDERERYNYERNRALFSESIANNKKEWMKEFIKNGIGLNSDTYNMLAELAMAIAHQESKFGTSKTFMLKSGHPETVSEMKGGGVQSVGITQMKFDEYNPEAKEIMKKLGINTSADTDNQRDINNAAKATMALLAYMYKNQLTPAHRRKLNAAGLGDEQALALMFNGKSVEWLENLVSQPGWEDKLITVSKYPGGIGRNLPFDLGKKEVLVTDYANKASGYMQNNESFHLANGGIINKISSVYGNDQEKIRRAIANARARQNK